MPRPPSEFHGFIGQGRIVSRVRRQLQGARALGETCPSILLTGPSGVGKTEFARAVAKEVGGNLLAAYGRDAIEDLTAKILKTQTGDVVFIDEVHAAKTRVQEALYEVIDSSRLPKWARSAVETPAASAPPPSTAAVPGAPATAIAPAESSDFIEVPRIVLIAATDQPGRLLPALYKRMEMIEAFLPYSEREMRAIVDRLATDLRVALSGQARNLLASVCAGLPRNAKYHLRKLRREYPEFASIEISSGQVRRFLRAFGIDERGLADEHRLVLRHLSKMGKASIESLAQRLGTDVDHLRRMIEPALSRLGFIRIFAGGRTLTEQGKQWLTDLEARRTSGESHQAKEEV